MAVQRGEIYKSKTQFVTASDCNWPLQPQGHGLAKRVSVG
jgi:hypothetical protein